MRTCLSSVKSLVTQTKCGCCTGVMTQTNVINISGDSTHLTSRSPKQIVGQQRGGIADDVDVRKLHQRLAHRGLVRMSGHDSSMFLQGLVTNDMRQFDPNRGHSVMYTLLLNSSGRVLYDLIVYHIKKDGEMPYFLIECEQAVVPEFIGLLKKYKIRKKVDLVDVSEEFQVVAVFPENYTEALKVCNTSLSTDRRPTVLSCNRDPRLPSFGCRLVLPADMEGSSAIVNSEGVSDVNTYHVRRYMLGLPEGTLDLPPGHCTPLESNAVFLNGVSFTKGCYLGQELTARTHYTGIIRKRLIPVTFTSEDYLAKPRDTIVTPEGKNCGRFRNAVGKHGIALLRVADVIEHQGAFLVKNEDGNTVGEVMAHLPHWWPQQQDSEDVIKDVLRSTSDKNLWSTLKGSVQ